MGVVEPRRMQIVDGFGPGAPERTPTGASTGGVRTPPSGMPSASRRISRVAPAVVANRGALAGASPVRTHVSRLRSAALATTWSAPLLIGAPHPTDSATGPS